MAWYAGDVRAIVPAEERPHLSDVIFEALRYDVAETGELVRQHGEGVDDGLAVEGE